MDDVDNLMANAFGQPPLGPCSGEAQQNAHEQTAEEPKCQGVIRAGHAWRDYYAYGEQEYHIEPKCRGR